MGPVIGLRDPRDSISALTATINLVAVGLLIWGVASGAQPGHPGRDLTGVVTLVVVSIAWVVWTGARIASLRTLAVVSLAVMAVSGGILAGLSSLAEVFVGVAALGATMVRPLPVSIWTAAAGPLAMLVTRAVAGLPLSYALGGLGAASAGTILGVTRRGSVERAERQAELKVSEARADAERARAELLAGRNHLARELHDVLAHTLSALSLQLEALDAVLGRESAVPPAVTEQLEATKRLLREGLEEARGAVRALREDSVPLEDQLAKLAGDRGATMEVVGSSRSLGSDLSLALYRVAQEALTNAAKHAPGSSVALTLGFCDGNVNLSVSNELAPVAGNGSLLAASGAGYGLQGIRERVLLLGGTVEAGPRSGSWVVDARVPG